MDDDAGACCRDRRARSARRHLKADILDCLDAAAAADRQTWPYDLSAPIVMLLVLPFVKREADRLPEAFCEVGQTTSVPER